MAERFKRPSIVTPEEIERARMRERTGDMVPSVMRQSTAGTTGSGFIDQRMGEGFVGRLKNKFFPSSEESARRQTERTNTFLQRENQGRGFVPEGDYFQGLKGNPVARANQTGAFAPPPPAEEPPTNAGSRRPAPSLFNASQYAPGTTEVSTPLTRSTGSRMFTNNLESGASQSQVLGFEQNARSAPRTDRFNRGAQGVYSSTTGNFAAPDDERGQRTRDFAMRRGIPQVSGASTEDRVLAQQEAATSRFQRGENLPGEVVGADGITYMRGSRMDGGTGIVRTGGSGGIYGNAAADVIATAQRVGQRRGLRRDAAAAAEQEQQMFERGISETNAYSALQNARAQMINARKSSSKTPEGVEFIQEESLPGQPGRITGLKFDGNVVPFTDQAEAQAVLTLRDQLVSEALSTGQPITASQALRMAAEAYGLGQVVAPQQ